MPLKKTTSFKPTLYQHLATDYRRNLAVTAGAGTGKTEVLTRRIIMILGRKNYYLDRLMVLTFTDKAAVEMKERIYRAIERALKETGLPHFQKLKDTFLNNYISTIHSFCATLLREYPIEAGIDPYFRVLDETEKIFFLRRSINRCLRELAADRKDPDINLLSEDYSRPALSAAVFDLIQKREDTAEWVKHFENIDWPIYREHLDRYRSCILREITYKLLMEGRLRENLHTLETIRAGVPDNGYKLDNKLNAVLDLLRDIIDELENKAGVEKLSADGQEHDGIFDITDISRLRADLAGTLKLSGSLPKSWPEESGVALKRIFLETRYMLEAFPCDEFEITEEHELKGFSMLKALARVTSYCQRAYRDQKNEENYLDFQDLQLKLAHLLSSPDNSHIIADLRERFQFIMVDEFQDTNDLQWKIIRTIAADPGGRIINPRVFVVGDEKQAIYSFRGGDVRLFSRVRRELREANRQFGFSELSFELKPDQSTSYEEEYRVKLGKDHRERSGEIVFGDNFRSASTPINFFNLFFEDLLYRTVYEEYDARPQLLRCAGNMTAGSVELLLADKKGLDSDEESRTGLKPHLKEALMIADKIKEVFIGDDPAYKKVRERAAAGLPAVAILLNRRTMIKTYEEALRMNRISFSVVRGRGFFQRQEIVDLGNLLTLLVDKDDDAALCGFLRSPAGHVSDEGIFILTRAFEGTTLWNKLLNCAEATGETRFRQDATGHTSRYTEDSMEPSFSPRDRRALLNAAACLKRWFALSRRMPLTQFLRLVLKEGGSYVSLGRGSRGEQALSNVEKVIDSARELALQDHADLAGFAEWLNSRIDHVEDEGEADIDISLGGAVQIMTVHQAKGLEFPMVFVPDLGANFNLGEREPVFCDRVPHEMTISGEGIARRERTEIGIDAPDPQNEWSLEPILIKRIIKKQLRDKITAEKKRLFYVACTRAMDHLVLVGNANWHSDRLLKRITCLPADLLSSWLEWLNKFLGISFQIAGERGVLKYVNRGGLSLNIPYRMFSDEGIETGPGDTYRTEFPVEGCEVCHD